MTSVRSQTLPRGHLGWFALRGRVPSGSLAAATASGSKSQPVPRHSWRANKPRSRLEQSYEDHPVVCKGGASAKPSRASISQYAGVCESSRTSFCCDLLANRTFLCHPKMPRTIYQDFLDGCLFQHPSGRRSLVENLELALVGDLHQGIECVHGMRGFVSMTRPSSSL